MKIGENSNDGLGDFDEEADQGDVNDETTFRERKFNAIGQLKQILLSGNRVNIDDIPSRMEDTGISIIKKTCKEIQKEYIKGNIDLSYEQINNIAHLLISDFRREEQAGHQNPKLSVHLAGHGVYWMYMLDQHNFDTGLGPNLTNLIVEYSTKAITLSQQFFSTAEDERYVFFLQLKRIDSLITGIIRNTDPAIHVLIENYLNLDFFNPLSTEKNTHKISLNFQIDLAQNEGMFNIVNKIGKEILSDLKSILSKWEKFDIYESNDYIHNILDKLFWRGACTFQAYYLAHNLSYTHFANPVQRLRDINMFQNNLEFILVGMTMMSSLGRSTTNYEELMNIPNQILEDVKGGIDNKDPRITASIRTFPLKIHSLENISNKLYQQGFLPIEDLEYLQAIFAEKRIQFENIVKIGKPKSKRKDKK